MTENTIVTAISKTTGENDTDIVLAYFLQAKSIVLNRAYPFDETKTDIPDRYIGNVIEIASYLLNKRGAEGETAHSENGISRTYGAASIPDDMLNRIIPVVGVM